MDKTKNRSVPYFRPEIGDAEIGEVVECLRSGWLTTGPRAAKFETEFAAYVGARYAVALNSCTAALHLALEAIGLKRGDAVIVPTMTFAATAEVVRYFDATPVFVDCDETLCLDPRALEETLDKLGKGRPVAGLRPPYGPVRAVIPMHYGGAPCRMREIADISARHEAAIIEDCAHTLPAHTRKNAADPWVHTGRQGLVGCFSFYANKCITTGEGGMAVTDDPAIADRIRLMSLHGMNRDAWKRFTAQGSWYYEIVAPGFKYNLTDMAAAVGLHQLRRADEFRARRERVALRYNRGFAASSALTTPQWDESNSTHSWHLYSLRLNLERLTIDRAEFVERLKSRGIICSVHWMPLHLNPYYRRTYGLGEGLFPVAERQSPRLISLPIYPSLSNEESDYIVESVLEIAAETAA